jgi:tetratricopeptide (TPR) repeat protein
VSARASVVATVMFAVLSIQQPGTSLAQPPEEPKNLKVLPKNMSRREVTGIMRSISQALGVRCVECHVSTKPGSERLEDLDFASDEKPEKESARKMMRMVGSINEQIGQMGFKDAVQVRCVTCHHGVKRPETLGAVMTKTIEKGGVDAAIENYRKLRDRYYGAAAYDFSPQALVDIAGDLAESKKDFDGAIRLLQLNLEFSPKHAGTHLALGQVQLAKGDRAAAIQTLERAIELAPDDRRAKQMLERAKSGQ